MLRLFPIRASAVFVFVIASGWLGGCGAAPGESIDETGEALSTSEGFESGTKTAYAAADVALGSGVWTLDDALVGSTTSDVTSGAKAARIRNGGRVTMTFDRAGAGAVSVKSATYGTDSDGAWALYYSTDAGGTWTQAGATVSTHPSTLATATFAINRAGTIRFQIRKTDGGANRIDVDDIAISDYGGGTDAGNPPSGGTSGARLSVHTKLGIPGAASTADWNRYLCVKSTYVLSYDSSRRIPNWVSWELNASYLGSAGRANDYRADDTLPSGMPQAKLSDYSGSGYARGHMCPSGDRTATAAANAQTFYLTNMIPQAADNNSGPWERLEVYARSLASAGKEIFVVAGGIGGSKTIGNGVVVPASTFKLLTVLDAPGQGASAVSTSTRVIAVVMPNDDSSIDASADWRSFRVSARSIEAKTGLDFMADVDRSIQDVIEARVDAQ